MKSQTTQPHKKGTMDSSAPVGKRSIHNPGKLSMIEKLNIGQPKHDVKGGKSSADKALADGNRKKRNKGRH